MKNILIISMLLISGCTLQEPVSPENAKPVKESKIFLFQSKNDASLIVTRDKGYYGSLCTVDFYIDGKLAAKFEPGEVATFYLNEGQHIVGVTSSGGCVGTPLNENEVTFKTGDSIRRRISSDGSTGFHIQPTSI